MILTLNRVRFAPEGIFGCLTDGFDFTACTLEHSYDNLPKVPMGTYTCKRGLHILEGASHNFITYEVMNVPGHNGILFHTGNVNDDSDGCILLGEMVQGNVLLNSRPMFSKFMELIGNQPTFSLIVAN